LGIQVKIEMQRSWSQIYMNEKPKSYFYAKFGVSG